MVHHELVALLAHEQLHVDTALGRGGDGVQQGLVGDEVGAGQRDPALRGVDQRGERAQVVLGRRSPARSGSPGRPRSRRSADIRSGPCSSSSASISPVSLYQSVANTTLSAATTGPSTRAHQLDPLAAGAGGSWACRSRARSGSASRRTPTCAVDHQDLAVVAQVRAAGTRPSAAGSAASGATGSRSPASRFEHCLVARDAARPEVVEEQPDRRPRARSPPPGPRRTARSPRPRR